MLSVPTRRLFPVLDPTIGRAVGAYFQYQKNEGLKESLEMTGTVNDGDTTTPDDISLIFERSPDGLVDITGSYGGAEVDIQIRSVEKKRLREKRNLIWGQAGETTQKTRAEIIGQLGEYPVSGFVNTHRKEIDIEMTPQLAESGKAVYVLPFAMSVTPTFGGAPAKVNGLPGHVPTTSTPLETTDRTSIDGQIGDLKLSTEQNWTTTTWTVSTNLRAGGSRVTMMQHEAAKESQKSQDKAGRSVEQRAYEVESGKSAKSKDRNYGLDFGAGVITGDLRDGETKLVFELKPKP